MSSDRLVKLYRGRRSEIRARPYEFVLWSIVGVVALSSLIIGLGTGWVVFGAISVVGAAFQLLILGLSIRSGENSNGEP
jgi:hypothetical protein